MLNRFFVVSCFILALYALIVYRLFDLGLFERPSLVQIAKKQHRIVIELEPKRGHMLDRKGRILATTVKSPSVYAAPRRIPDQTKPSLADTLSKILRLDKRQVLTQLSKNKGFIWLKRKITDEEAQSILALGNPHVALQNEHKRFYPHLHELAHVLGFCNIDNQGLEGLELAYDAYLRGERGWRHTKRDALGREVSALDEKVIPPVNGQHLVLHIDQFIQHSVEKELDKAFKKWNAKGAAAIVMDPQTGYILAMANRPSFDTNDYQTSTVEARRNRSITDFYEPGSIFKVVTFTAALSEGNVTLEDSFFCENGTWQAAPRRVIHDVHPYGNLTFPEVLIKSSNIGTVKVAKRIGEATLYRYIKKFGFGEMSGIELRGEVPGIVHPLNQWSKSSITSVPYGQEVTATALQMVRAISVIANGGWLVKPQVVKEIKDEFGVVIKREVPPAKEKILEPDICATVREILVRAVEEGTGQAAKIKGFKVAGKTGTAQKISPFGGYSHSNFVSSFMGFAPAGNPALAIIVMVDDPHPSYYGGTVAAPVFKAVLEESLLYLGYSPEPSSSQKEEVVPTSPLPAQTAVRAAAPVL